MAASDIYPVSAAETGHRMGAAVQTSTRRRLAILFCVPLAFSLLFFIANQAAQHTDLGLQQLESLSGSVNALLLLCTNAQVGERGFLLTGDEKDLIPLREAQAFLPSQIDLCRTYAKDRLDLAPQVSHIIQDVRTQFTESDTTLNLARSGSFVEALAVVKSGRGEVTMTDLRNSVAEFQKQLDHIREQYLDHQQSINQLAFIFFLLGTATMVVVLAWLYRALITFIQEREDAQAQLQALNTELEQRIDERTRELQDSNEELQQFAYVASHDLQEPLRTITSFTQLLANRYQAKLDEDADEFIGYIVTSSRRMTELINGLLALVRLRKAGQGSSSVAFQSLLEEAEACLQAAIRESGARIECSPLPSLVVDKVQLTQVLQNLISNAIKYKRDEPPLIQIGARRENNQWIFSVADNGQGFEKQYAERIFGIFQRLHGREVEGTGMGLSITRKIIERHGGRIWAESAPGVGSTFYFSLPTSLETNRQSQASTPVPASTTSVKTAKAP
jgi:signal transduction histidine kinase